MSEIEVYTFEDGDDEPVGDCPIYVYSEAKAYARKHGLAVIANTYEWTDSELVDDYRPARCAECGRPEAELHTGDCPLAIAQDHRDGDHSGCEPSHSIEEAIS